jgi:hypothetical protein
MVAISDQTTPAALLADLASTSMVDPVKAANSNSALTAQHQLPESALPACQHSNVLLSVPAQTQYVDALSLQLSTGLPILVYLQKSALMASTIPETINALSVPRPTSVLDAIRPPVLALNAYLECSFLLVLPCAFQEVHLELKN